MTGPWSPPPPPGEPARWRSSPPATLRPRWQMKDKRKTERKKERRKEKERKEGITRYCQCRSWAPSPEPAPSRYFIWAETSRPNQKPSTGYGCTLDFTVNCRLLSVYRRLFPLVVQLAWYGIPYLRASRITKFESVTSQWMSWAMSKNLKVE